MIRLALILVLLSGCVAPREAFRNLPDPQSLDDVNALLAGETVDLVLVGAEPISGARNATVASDSVRFTLGRSSPRRAAVVTSEVAQITAVRGRGTRYGAALGTIPGLLVIYSGIKESGSRRQGQRDAGTAGLAVSVPAILVGAAVGAWLGQLTTPGETVPLYRSPVTRYAPASSTYSIQTDR